MCLRFGWLTPAENLSEPLKNRFGAEIPIRIAGMISSVDRGFPQKPFLKEVLKGYEALDLMARGRKIAEALRCHLPDDYRVAIGILTSSMGPRLDQEEDLGMTSFLYLPHSFFIAKYGLDHWEVSMRAQYELTQRFTAEFSIRPFLEHHREATLERLKKWTADPSLHVRRLVSEGTRPRLPWAPRLREFQKDPRPVLELLEYLRDDPELYVRRSVANNLNDIGKDHPSLLVQIARRWMKDAGKGRSWLVRHALRSAVKRGEREALKVLGYGKNARVTIVQPSVFPRSPRIGGKVILAFGLKNKSLQPQRVMVDFCIHFVKANGKTRPKVFKWKELDLLGHGIISLRKKVSLAQMTTRKHYPGIHRVDLLLNGSARPLAWFRLAKR